MDVSETLKGTNYLILGSNLFVESVNVFLQLIATSCRAGIKLANNRIFHLYWTY